MFEVEHATLGIYRMDSLSSERPWVLLNKAPIQLSRHVMNWDLNTELSTNPAKLAVPELQEDATAMSAFEVLAVGLITPRAITIYAGFDGEVAESLPVSWQGKHYSQEGVYRVTTFDSDVHPQILMALVFIGRTHMIGVSNHQDGDFQSVKQRV